MDAFSEGVDLLSPRGVVFSYVLGAENEEVDVAADRTVAASGRPED